MSKDFEKYLKRKNEDLIGVCWRRNIHGRESVYC